MGLDHNRILKEVLAMKAKIDKGDFTEEVQNGKRIKYINI